MRRRVRSAAYRARRRLRLARRHIRAAHWADYHVMLERTPGYGRMLERDRELDLLEASLFD